MVIATLAYRYFSLRGRRKLLVVVCFIVAGFGWEPQPLLHPLLDTGVRVLFLFAWNLRGRMCQSCLWRGNVLRQCLQGCRRVAGLWRLYECCAGSSPLTGWEWLCQQLEEQPMTLCYACWGHELRLLRLLRFHRGYRCMWSCPCDWARSALACQCAVCSLRNEGRCCRSLSGRQQGQSTWQSWLPVLCLIKRWVVSLFSMTGERSICKQFCRIVSCLKAQIQGKPPLNKQGRLSLRA